MASPTFVRGTNDKPAASDSLAQCFEGVEHLDGQLFIGYAIIGSADGKYPIDAVYVSPSKGIVVFDLVDGTVVNGYEDRQDDAATKLQSRLLTYRELVHRRRLIPSLRTMTYAPAASSRTTKLSTEYPVANRETLLTEISRIEWADADGEIYRRTLSALQNISTIRKSRSTRTLMDGSWSSRLSTSRGLSLPVQRREQASPGEVLTGALTSVS